jgi:hypothetical protein
MPVSRVPRPASTRRLYEFCTGPKRAAGLLASHTILQRIAGGRGRLGERCGTYGGARLVPLSPHGDRDESPRSALQAPLDLFENLFAPVTRITHHARCLAAVATLGEQHVEHRDRSPQGVAQRAPVGVGQLLIFGHHPILSQRMEARIMVNYRRAESNIRAQMGNRPRRNTATMPSPAAAANRPRDADDGPSGAAGARGRQEIAPVIAKTARPYC